MLTCAVVRTKPSLSIYPTLTWHIVPHQSSSPMATSSLTSTLTHSNSPLCPYPLPQFPSRPTTPFASKPKSLIHGTRRSDLGLCVKAQTLDFSGSFFEGGFGSEDDPPYPPVPGATAVEEKEAPECPPGLRQYETMAVLRPDMSEDERLTLTQKYEEVTKDENKKFFLIFLLLFCCFMNSHLIPMEEKLIESCTHDHMSIVYTLYAITIPCLLDCELHYVL